MSGGITFYDPENIANGDMLVLNSGMLDIYNNIDGTRRKTASLNRAAVGSAAINAWTELPGYWQNAPSVLLAPKKLPTYFTDFQLSTQRFTLSPTVELVSEGVYKIYPAVTFYADGLDVSENPALTIEYEYNGPGNPHPPKCTPFYPCAGGNLTVNFKYRLTYKSATQGSEGDEYYMNTSVYLDVARGSSYSSYLLTSRSSWPVDTEQEVTATQDVGEGFCMWRLRRESSCSNRRTHGANVGSNYDYFNFVSYSFSFTGGNPSLTDGEVFYLAVGR